jgi:hypothetical protein
VLGFHVSGAEVVAMEEVRGFNPLYDSLSIEISLLLYLFLYKFWIVALQALGIHLEPIIKI